MLYIMHRTQLYLDEALWTTLQARAKKDGTTISELVRIAARERYLDNFDERKAAMLAVVGLWKDRTDMPDTDTYIRNIRNEDRLGLSEAE